MVALPSVKNIANLPGSTLKNGGAETPVKPEPLRVLLKWRAPGRLFRARDREYFTTVWAIAILAGIILLFFKEWFLVAVIIALAFLDYIRSTVKPEEVDCQITNRGIEAVWGKFLWTDLGRFWFEEKWGQKLLEVETVSLMPGRITLLLGTTSPDEVKKVLSQYLLNEKPEQTWVDKASAWFSRQLPIGKTV